jgi:glutamyl/glutaminyl-tRNA synthetase
MLVYHAMGADPPVFAHVPLILDEDRSKLSKRKGAASIEELRAQGYLPGAVFNYLALLGWSHPQEKEVLEVDALVEAFDIKRINNSAAVLDPRKLAWMNGQHIRRHDPEALYALAAGFLPEWVHRRYDEAQRREIVALLHDHVESLSNLDKQAQIFHDDVVPDEEAAAVLASEASQKILHALAEALRGGPAELTPTSFKDTVKAVGKSLGVKGKDLFFPVRAALTGNLHGPDLARIAAIKGKERVIAALGG